MKVVFDAPRVVAGGDVPMPRPIEDAAQGALDFAALVDARGSRVLAQSAVGGATRFDEGSLFGRAIGAPPCPMPGRADAASTGRGGEEDRTRPEVMPDGASSSEALRRWAMSQPSSPAVVDAAAPVHSRAASTTANVPISIVTTSLRCGRNVPASVTVMARRDTDRGARARFVDQLGPAHVVMRVAEGGVQLIARVAGIGEGSSEHVARALDDAVTADGRRLAGLRLNGRDSGWRGGDEDHG